MNTKTKLYPKIEQEIKGLDISKVSKTRIQILQPFIDYVQSKVSKNNKIRLNFICTHNSRRSHLSQVWAQTMAHHCNINNVFCYSGGTETTALFPMIIKILINSGFKIKTISENKNPVYNIKYTENEHPIIGFSKTYDDDFNPKAHFAALMTCAQADKGCPHISGAENRIALKYDDPKVFDNTPQQVEKYKERSLQIATEMLYVFSQIKN
ncbi:MAG: protein-tyrosine-phosphatase [Flavobacteriaceae bacterium]|nr:protein-tyrosine-phosphatase [Flavobacteriaceae bacterium]